MQSGRLEVKLLIVIHFNFDLFFSTQIYPHITHMNYYRIHKKKTNKHEHSLYINIEKLMLFDQQKIVITALGTLFLKKSNNCKKKL